jgi:hypothetical protein
VHGPGRHRGHGDRRAVVRGPRRHVGWCVLRVTLVVRRDEGAFATSLDQAPPLVVLRPWWWAHTRSSRSSTVTFVVARSSRWSRWSTQTRRTAERVLPGARFKRLVRFRYFLTWTRPAAPTARPR